MHFALCFQLCRKRLITLKIRFPYGSVGSSPTVRTSVASDLSLRFGEMRLPRRGLSLQDFFFVFSLGLSLIRFCNALQRAGELGTIDG